MKDTSLQDTQVGDRPRGDESLAPGAVVGPFVIERFVAAGGMGEVYRAIDPGGERVALKLILDRTPATRARFLREASALARVQHDAVVRYVAHGEALGAGYLAMQWLEGPTLAEFVADRPQRARPGLELEPALRVAERVARALGALHRGGIVHRDVKPANVLLPGGDPARATLLDLGLARGLALDAVTRTGVLLGTPLYMSPEQAVAAGQVGPGTDVWSLGCILFEMLAGQPPFAGDSVLAILAKISLETARDLRSLRTDVPAAVARWVQRMLAKNPSDRPGSDEVAEALAQLAGRSSGELPVPPPGERISSQEVRHGTLLLARLPTESDPDRARSALERLGVATSYLLDGTLLGRVRGLTEPRERAERAGRAALLLRGLWGEAAVVVVSGMDTPGAAGGLAERAASALEATGARVVWTDGATAALLEGKFVLQPAPRGALLEAERGGLAQPRKLPGGEAPCVGRERELSALMDALAECADEQQARAVVVKGPAGVGKSRLAFELLRRVERARPEVGVLHGRCGAAAAEAPFSLLGRLLREQAGMQLGDGVEQQRERLRERLRDAVAGPELRRVEAFLAEAMGLGSEDDEPALRGARRDPALMRAGVEEAWVSLLGAECARRPVLLLVEDLHRADALSVQLLDASLRLLRDRPLLLLALARPELSEVFPGLWERRSVHEIHVAPLGKRASEQLVRGALGQRADEATVARLVDLAGGNPFYIEELVRAVDRGDQVLPETLLGAVQARFETLAAPERQALRAASVFGEVFWTDGVARMLNAEPDEVRLWLRSIVEDGAVRSSSHSAILDQEEYAFRHALIRDAAYASFLDEDRALAHALAGEWLEQHGERDARTLAEHYRRGDRPRDAGRWLQRAAEQALDASDMQGALALAEQALGLGASGEDEGALRFVQASAYAWQGRLTDAWRCAEGATRSLTVGSSAWFRAIGEMLSSAGRRGDIGEVQRGLQLARQTEPLDAALADRIICLVRGTFQLLNAGLVVEADQTLDALAALAPEPERLGPLAAAQVCHLRGYRALNGGDLGGFARWTARARQHFLDAGDERNVLEDTPSYAFFFVQIGATSRAEQMLLDAARRSERLGLTRPLLFGSVVLCLSRLARDPSPDHQAQAREVRERCVGAGNLRMAGMLSAALASVALSQGDPVLAEQQARRAVGEEHAWKNFKAWALALLARSLLALGRPQEALDASTQAFDLLLGLGGAFSGEPIIFNAHAECLQAAGDPVASARVVSRAVARLGEQLAGLDEPAWRDSYLAQPENQKTLALARRLA